MAPLKYELQTHFPLIHSPFPLQPFGHVSILNYYFTFFAIFASPFNFTKTHPIDTFTPIKARVITVFLLTEFTSKAFRAKTFHSNKITNPIAIAIIKAFLFRAINTIPIFLTNTCTFNAFTMTTAIIYTFF
jgi:hypothetical protein